ncbi:MAG: 30S ribosomal protein S4 [Spirochaetes bacterium]|nr:30S ribosomal protein S4 [Spirochaetota bacterium]
MARLVKAKCKLCRRAGVKLMLKGDRCVTPKCALEKRKYPPGQRPRRGMRVTNYLLQIREKQKLKRIYGLMERQFRKIFNEAAKKKGATGDILISLLERRLDNVVYRLSFASSRQQARQMVRLGHVQVNNKKVNIPSYITKEGDLIIIKEKSRKLYPILKSMGKLENIPVPEWLSIDIDKFTGKVVKNPERKDIELPVQEQLIVELYSKV